MSLFKKAILTAGLLLLAVTVYLGFSLQQQGFSARARPSRLEELVGREARKIAMPSDAKTLKIPYPATPEALAEGREHWADHCAPCHALNGSGDTTLGRNLYPKAPDFRASATQKLTDGEIYYIITNGVRFTGMPAWGGEHSPEETWHLVAFIRHLPQLTPEELKQMQQMAHEESDEHEHDPETHGHRHSAHPDPRHD